MSDYSPWAVLVFVASTIALGAGLMFVLASMEPEVPDGTPAPRAARGSRRAVPAVGAGMPSTAIAPPPDRGETWVGSRFGVPRRG